MAQKYYAVAFGREGSGIYTQWDQTEANVKGVSGVRYKAFASEAAAREFLIGHNVPAEQIRHFPEPGSTRADRPVAARPRAGAVSVQAAGPEPTPVNPDPVPVDRHRLDGPMHAYVDGSFRQGYDVYGYGVVIVAGDAVVKTLSGIGTRAEYVSMRNVAGEILGAIQAMKYAVSAGADHLVLYFDYQGIESWANGTWKRNNDLTRGYHEFVTSIRKKLRITFCKVKGHSGDEYNDLADELAKAAVAASRD